tara:strand:+ start:581 stop:820 length:240 start_codon:yes stop_codon:yes gene_type:complete
MITSDRIPELLEFWLSNGQTYESLSEAITERITTLKNELKSFEQGVRPSYVSSEIGERMSNISNYEKALELLEGMQNDN